MIKLVVTDIDGTIFHYDGTCSDKVRNTIKKLDEKGIKLVLATGRMYKATFPIAKELGLKTPVSCYQGALVQNFYENKDVLYSQYTDKNKALEAIDYFRKNNIHTNVYVDDILYVEEDDDYIKEYAESKKIDYKVIEDITKIDMSHLHKVLGIHKNATLIEKATNELSEKFKETMYIVRSTPHFCEVSSPKASKAEALKFLANYWGFKIDEVLSIGDQDNDIDMIEAAGIGVAMGNGTKALKEKADFITKSIEDDGFCYAMERFCDV